MRIPGMYKFRRVARRLKKRFVPSGLILLYHRVAEVGSDPWSLCVTPHHFAEQLEVLQKHARPVRLNQLNQALEYRRRPVAVTFDDGYADNLYNAKPLLERYDIPATVFMTTGHIGREREFWSDELDRLLLQPGKLPKDLSLCVNDISYHWELGDAADYSQDAYQRHRGWSALGEDNPSPRHSLYRSLYYLLRFLPAGERTKVLDRLLAWADAEVTIRPSHRFLSRAELMALDRGELIEIGSHTVSHPFLSALSAGSQQEEIQRSKAALEEILGHPVTSLAYPHGDYTKQTVAIAQAAGFTYACSTAADVVWQSSDRFQLPRVQVQDWDGEEFARQLSRWFHG